MYFYREELLGICYGQCRPCFRRALWHTPMYKINSCPKITSSYTNVLCPFLVCLYEYPGR